jgi:crotonobetainyl-CoA:carnitine CoA-transferase CaiB-like acyl-CoA transferase
MNQSMLQDLKVIELSTVLAGPAVGMFFAELGASVLKIENKTTAGDVTRSWKLTTEDPSWAYSAYYCSVNWGKEILLMDLNQPEELAWVLEQIKSADVVLANFKPESAQRLGLDYASLKPLNPRLIYGEITGYGPNDDRSAFDVVLQAEAGFLYMTGEKDGNPVKMPVALIDLLAAHQLKEGILLALLQRAQTGSGSKVSVSLYAAALASLVNQATNWLIAQKIPQRMGTLHPNIAPYGELFVCRDGGQIVLAIGNDRQFQYLCKALQLDELAQHADYIHNNQRVLNRTALQAQLQAKIELQDREPLLKQFHQMGVPAGGLRNMQEVFSDPLAHEMLLDWALPDGTEVKSVRSVAFTLEQ